MQALVPGVTFLMPEVTTLLLTYLERHEERVLGLITRAATDAGITKRLFMHSMIAFQGESEEKVDVLEGEAYRAVSRSLYRPLASIENLLDELRPTRP